VASVLYVLIRTEVPDIYGGEKSTVSMAGHMGVEGFDATFLTTARDAFVDFVESNGLHCEVVPVRDPMAGLRSSSWPNRLRKLRDIGRVNRAVFRAARAGKAEIVHVAGAPGFYCTWAGAKAAGAKTIYHVRTASRDSKTRWFEAVAILLADRTIAVSSSLRDQLVSTASRPLRHLLGRRIAAIFNGFEFDEIDRFIRAESQASCRRQMGVSDDRVNVIFVGGIFVDKGQLEFINKALPKVAAAVPSVMVTFVGGVKNEAYKQSCDEAIERLGLAKNVRFTGYLPQRDVYRFYRSGDVSLLASTREGLPRAVIEAQSFGLPVVATAAVGTTDALRHGVTGFIVPVDDVGALADPLIMLARDAKLRAKMGAEGAAHVRREFSIERTGHAVAELYRGML
jgi:glycosyltransferase involved in cell wall biosynthesis